MSSKKLRHLWHHFDLVVDTFEDEGWLDRDVLISAIEARTEGGAIDPCELAAVKWAAEALVEHKQEALAAQRREYASGGGAPHPSTSLVARHLSFMPRRCT